MNAVANYCQDWSEQLGKGWNRFWFTPADPSGLALLRWGTGLLALVYLLSFSTDLITWFGRDGMLPVATVQQLTAEADGNWNARASYWNYLDSPAAMWAVHGAGIVVVLAFTVGLATRITGPLSLAVVLSYIHRAPLLTGQFEPILTMLLFYLCLAPCGGQLSIDAWLRRRRLGTVSTAPSLAAGICLRLIQVHVAALYLMMALTMLGGSDTWWMGEAIWWLIAHTESRLVDWTGLATWEYLLNFWTQGVVMLEFLFALLIWNRLARPLLLAVASIHWVLLGLLTGLLSYSAVMLLVNLVFLAPQTVSRCVARWPGRPAPAV